MRLSHNLRSSEERIASVPVSRQDIRCVWWFREGALLFFFREIPAGSSWGRAVEGDTGGLENNARPGTQPQNMYAAYKREKTVGGITKKNAREGKNNAKLGKQPKKLSRTRHS
jgi:hypothetical protein